MWSNTYFVLNFIIIEGKDKSSDAPPSEFGHCSSTTELLLQLCKTTFNTVKIVILDSLFCVLEAQLKLRIYGVYPSVVVKIIKDIVKNLKSIWKTGMLVNIEGKLEFSTNLVDLLFL